MIKYANSRLALIYFANLQSYHNNASSEGSMLVRLQSYYRMSMARKRFRQAVLSCRLMQRIWRGYTSRIHARERQLFILKARRHMFYTGCAVCIQRTFRGYWTRRYVHDFYARKKYLLDTSNKGDLTVKYLNDVAARRIEDEARVADENQRLQVANATSMLHHLLSTKIIPGVYNPPYADDIPSYKGIPLENLILQNAQPVNPPLSTVATTAGSVIGNASVTLWFLL